MNARDRIATLHLIFLWLFFFSVVSLSFLSFSVFSFFSFLGCVGEANCCVTCWATSWETGRGFLWGEKKQGRLRGEKARYFKSGWHDSSSPELDEKDYVGKSKLKQVLKPVEKSCLHNVIWEECVFSTVEKQPQFHSSVFLSIAEDKILQNPCLNMKFKYTKPVKILALD